MEDKKREESLKEPRAERRRKEKERQKILKKIANMYRRR